MRQSSAHNAGSNAYAAAILMVLAACSFSLSAQQDNAQQAERAGNAEQAQQQPPPPPDTSASIDELQQAYQKEFAYLQSQKRELSQRLERLRKDYKQAENEAETRIARIEGEVAGLQSRADRLNQQLTEADRKIASIEENRQVLDATFTQADATLQEYDIDTLDGEAFQDLGDENKIQTLFSAGIDLLDHLRSLRVEQGKFYLEDGTEVAGRILHVGQVAAYGVSPEGAGTLAPAGEQKLKLWDRDTAETARAVIAGSAPASLPIFLFESLTQPIEKGDDRGLIGTIQDGGTIAWIIVALGILAAVLILLRAFFLQQASASTERIIDEVGKLVQQGRVDDALSWLRGRRSAIARVVSAALRNLDRDRAHLEDIISESILHESSHLNRFGSFILVIAAVSPLLGLLGTVTGMISTFDVITEFGTGDPKLLSGGISIALITTQVGLTVAIPALLMGNLLSGWGDSIKDDMEKAALRIVNLYQEHRRPGAETAS